MYWYTIYPDAAEDYEHHFPETVEIHGFVTCHMNTINLTSILSQAIFSVISFRLDFGLKPLKSIHAPDLPFKKL